MAAFEVSTDIDVGAVLGAVFGAAIRECVCPLVGVDADVGRDPVDSDRDGEVSHGALDGHGKVGVCERAPAQRENSPSELAVGGDV